MNKIKNKRQALNQNRNGFDDMMEKDESDDAQEEDDGDEHNHFNKMTVKKVLNNQFKKWKKIINKKSYQFLSHLLFKNN